MYVIKPVFRFILLNFVIESWTCAISEHVVYTIPLRSAELARETALAEAVGTQADGNGTDVEKQKNNIRGRPGLGYYIEVDIGTPPQSLNVLIDTGSSNFAVAAAPHNAISTYYHTNESSTYKDQSRHVEVPYTQGKWSGDLGRDIVTIPSMGAQGFQANIAAIRQSEEFFLNGSRWQGILGLAYAKIARPDATLEPFFESLTNQTTTQDIFALQMCGALASTNRTALPNVTVTDVPVHEVIGSMNIGGLDPTLYEEPILYAPIREEWFYEVIMTDIKVGNESLGFDCKEYNFDKTIVDSGTTNLRLPERVFAATKKAIQERTVMTDIPDEFWSGESMMCPKESVLPYEPYFLFPTLTLDLQSTTEHKAFSLVISPQQYLRHDYDHEEKTSCFKFAISPSSNDAGAVIGAVVMEGFYVVFDRANKRVGFARSTCPGNCENDGTCVGNAPRVTDLFNIDFDPEDCGYQRSNGYNPALTITAYVLAAVCVLCLIPVIVLTITHQVNRRCKGHGGRGVIHHHPHHRLDQEFLEASEP